MTSELEATFRDLGISQYLDSFVDQGFDTWDTILDIQESDLCVPVTTVCTEMLTTCIAMR